MVNNSDTKVRYRGNGSNRVFPITFPFTENDYICVRIADEETGEVREIESDFLVDNIAQTVTYPGWETGQEPPVADQPAVLTSDETITIYRKTEISQLTELGIKFPLPQIEKALDKVTNILQEHDEAIVRAVKVDIASEEESGYYYEQMMVASENAVAAAAGAAASQAAAALSETNAAASETAAANSATAAAASETAATNSATAAAASETAAALSETNAAASETAAANSATAAAASETAAALSETNAAASKAAAALSETNAAASETAAGTSATAAAASQAASANSAIAAAASQTAAAASETAAALSETNAAASETAAALSKTNAAASETAAAASETAAISSQQAAALSAGAAADSATAAANSAAAAAGVISAAQTAQTAAAASASMAVANAELAAQAATTATTKAGQANTSAQAAQAAAAQAAASASSATTSAQGAANSATAAAGSASDAAASATAAAASAAAAADSATAASTSYDQAAAAVVDVLDIVAEAAVTFPSQSGTLTYTGSSQSPTWDSYYQPNKVTVSGTQSATNAGTYTVTFTLKSGYYWLTDDTTAPKTQTWTIGRQAIDTVPSQSGVLVYDGTTKTASFANYSTTKLTKGGTYSAVNAGTYTATFTPKSNYKWSDGTTTAKSVQWTINAQTVTAPTVTNTSKTYTGSAQGPTISSYDSSLIEITGATATNSGSYTLTMHLKTNSLLWSDGTTADKTFAWSISPATVTAPTVTDTALTYSGAAQGPTISSYDTTAIVQSGTASATVVGSYSVTFSLASEGNYIWSDSTTASKTFSWSISAASVTVPTLSNTSKTYDGTIQGPIISAYDANVVQVGGDATATDAGTHTVTFHLIDSSNYTWADSSITDKSATWTMAPKAISAPSVTGTSKTYSGSSQSPTIGSFSATEITQGGTASATNAGSYSVTFSLASNNYIWSDETTADKSVSWTISPKTVTVPTVTDTSRTYTGSSQGPTISAFSTTEITKGGTSTATNAGSYSVTFSLTSTTNYIWNDETTSQKSVSWTIGPKAVTVPTVTGTSKTYSGSSQGPTIGNFSSTEITQGGTASATNAGSYSVTFSLASNNYIWSDETTAQKSVAWTIAKAAGSLSISKNSVSLTSAFLTDTITASRLGDGTISAISGDSNICTTSISGTTITITAVGNGTTSITVSVAEGTNHLASSALSITVSVQLYKTMTVKIDESDSNPETCCTYYDDAVGMTPGSDDWDTFFGHYPCMLLNGVEGGKLKRNDFTKYENGTSADITSGAEGDVMIRFPRRGLKISKSGSVITISMTDNPDDNKFGYMAHSRAGVYKSRFYLGVYKGSEVSGKLRSLSGKTCATNKTIGAFRTLAQANGAQSGFGKSGYDQSGWYQLVYRQCMYVLKYKTLDSQSAVGRGFVKSNSAQKSTGGTETRGMDWGESTGKDHMKLFGLEDFWGNISECVDGYYIDSSRNIMTANQGFNDTGSDYTSRGIAASANITYSYMKSCVGDIHSGFTPTAKGGSATTYFCDSAALSASCLSKFGGTWNDDSSAGAFTLYAGISATSTSAALGARLMYV